MLLLYKLDKPKGYNRKPQDFEELYVKFILNAHR